MVFDHAQKNLEQYDQELGEAIELEYLRFMPFMNKALARLVQEEHPQYANDAGDQVRVIDVTSRDTLKSPFRHVHARCTSI